MSVTDAAVLEELTPEPQPGIDWPLLARLPERLAAAQSSAAACRELLSTAHEELKARFLADEPVEGLVRARAAFTDIVLRTLWAQQLEAGLAQRLCLVAVGGYGRGELHPYSDVDILVLVPTPLDGAERSQVETLVSFLWDIGLEVGHSVRTVQECAEESAADVGVMTPKRIGHT